MGHLHWPESASKSFRVCAALIENNLDSLIITWCNFPNLFQGEIMKKIFLAILFCSTAVFAATKTYDVDFQLYQNDQLLSNPKLKVYPGSLAMVTNQYSGGAVNMEFVANPNLSEKKKKEIVLNVVLTHLSVTGEEVSRTNPKIVIEEGKTGELKYKDYKGADMTVKVSIKSSQPQKNTNKK